MLTRLLELYIFYVKVQIKAPQKSSRTSRAVECAAKCELRAHSLNWISTQLIPSLVWKI